MALHPPGNRRERLLVYGLSKQGKSTTWLDIAEWIYQTGSKSRLWVGDTDVAWEAMRPLDGHLDHICQVRDLFHMDDYRNWVKEFIAKANRDRNDWLVLDMADRLYNECKAEFFRRTNNGKEFDEFLIESHNDPMAIGGAYGKNWDAINNIYDRIISNIHRFPGHVLVTAPAQEVREPTERSSKGADPEWVRDMFGTIGMRPRGQAQLPHLFHTVLYVAKSPSGYRLTTVGDRNRRNLTGEIIGETKDGAIPQFVAKYLIGVAGWRP